MGVSVRVVARAPGRATITAMAMPLAGPDSHAGQKDILSYPALRDTITIDVTPKLGSSCDQPVLVSPHGTAQLFDSYRPHQDVKHSLVHPSQGVGCGDIVRSVTRDGQLKAGDTLGHCYVHVAATDSNQAIVRHVVVDRISLLVSGPHREGETVLDVGTRVEYKIVPKDSLGNEFSNADKVRLDFEVAPRGVVKLQLENLSLQVVAERPGKAVVRVFLESDPKVHDFFEIHVRETAQSVHAASHQGSPQNQGYYVKVYADKPVSHQTPLEPTWYRVEFLQSKDASTDAAVKPTRFQCSILEGQWATAHPHSTSTANYCIVTPTIPASTTDVIPSLTLAIDSSELQLHHKQSIPLTPIFAVVGPTERKFPTNLAPQTVTLFASTPHVRTESSHSLRVRPVSPQRPLGSGYVTDYLVEFTHPPSQPSLSTEEDLFVRFMEEGGKGSSARINFTVEEGTSYLLLVLCALLVVVLTVILCGIPYRTFQRSLPTKGLPSQPVTSPFASRTPGTPSPSFPTTPSTATSAFQSPPATSPTNYLSPPLTPQTPNTVNTPSRFGINSTPNFYDSQRLRGPKF